MHKSKQRERDGGLKRCCVLPSRCLLFVHKTLANQFFMHMINSCGGRRLGSLGEFSASLASHAAAPSHTHLCAIKHRKSGLTEEQSPDLDNLSRRGSKRDNLRNVSVRHHEMIAPKIIDSLSWGK